MEQFTIEEVVDGKFLVYLENEEQWNVLNNLECCKMTGKYYGQYCYYPKHGTYCYINSNTIRRDYKTIRFEQIIFNKAMKNLNKIKGYISNIDLFGGIVPAGTIYVQKPFNDILYVTANSKFVPTNNVMFNMPKEIVEQWEPIYEEYYDAKVSDWVYVSALDGIYRLMDIDSKKIIGKKQDDVDFMICVKQDEYHAINKYQVKRLASDSEIFDAAVKQANQDGFKIGSYVVDLYPTTVPKLGKIKEFFINNYPIRKDTLVLWFTTEDGHSYVLYNDHNIPIWKSSSTPIITINGLIGEFKGDEVHFGCATIHKNLFIHLSKSIIDSPTDGNRHVEGINIGKGTFTMEQIDEIAEYYLNNQ